MELKNLATSLRIAGGRSYNRAALVRAFLSSFEKHYLHSCAHGFDEMMNHWNANNCTTGHQVVVKQETQELEGIAEGVTASGALLLRRPDGTLQEVLSGDLIRAC